MLKTLIIVICLAAIGGGAYAWYASRGGSSDTTFRTAAARRGDLAVTKTATGIVQAEEVIDVGAQVAGRVLAFGTDSAGKQVDYRSEVKKDMTLAQIDEAMYQTDVEQARAQVAQANAKLAESRAGIDRANADLNQLKAKLAQAENDWKRAQKLGPSEALAQSQYDAYEAAYLTAKANLEIGDVAIRQAKTTEASAIASVASAQAMLNRAEQNLAYCTIKSPVDGVIIDRRVGIGQTVVSSLNAPSLFLIAKDLKKMEVWFAVSEADIGSIFPGQKVTFTADTFPGETFNGTVSKVRLNANITQNVVTYTVEVSTDNSSGRLLPYLTANGTFEVTRRDDVMMVPNSALRFSPSKPEDIVPEARATAGSKPAGERQGRGEGGGRRPSTQPTTGPSVAPYRPATVWIKEGKLLRPVKVTAGISDGSSTEIRSDVIKDGTEVVVGEARSAAAPGGAGGGSPFTPQMRPGGGGGRR